MREKTQATFITIFSAIFSWIGILIIPVLALIVLNIVDYITRFIANKVNNVINESKKSIKGIYKKFGMWLVIASCAVIDVILINCGQQIGISIAKLPFKYVVATIVAIWFVFNEFISILENVREMGTRSPKFILTLANKLLGKIDKLGDSIVDSIDEGVIENEDKR